MLKKLLIPCFVFAASVAIGCGSSTPSKTGTAGSGGGTAGSGTAGAGGGTAGAGTAGAGGAGTAGAAGGTAGAGTAGAGGGTAGAGTAGAGGGTAGAGTAGAGGSDAGTDAGGTAGADGGGTDTGGGSTVAASKLACPAKVNAMNDAVAFSAEDFCMLYKDVCGGKTFAGMLTDADCIATYNGWATKKVTGATTKAEQSCVSYHVCNALSDATTHCPHAAGTSVCVPTN